MKKTVSITLTTLLVLAGSQGFAQKNPLTLKSLHALTGQVPSAFSRTAPLSVRSVNMLGRSIASAQFALSNARYVPATELLNREVAANRLSHLPTKQVEYLHRAFTEMDEKGEVKNFRTKTFLRQVTALPNALLEDVNVELMTELLDLQNYMVAHNNEFPQLFTPISNGWKVTASGLDSAEGNRAFWNMLEILVREQEGKASPVVVEQLVTLRQNASNRPSVEALVQALNDWRKAFPDADPTLPQDVQGISLWQEAEKLWLVTEIRLLQLTPGIELPEVLRNAKVTR